MATVGDISSALVGGAQWPFSCEAGRGSWTGLKYGKVDDSDKRPKDNYRAVMKRHLNVRNLQAEQDHLKEFRSRLAEEITKVDSELTRVGNEIREAAAELEDTVQGGVRTEAGEALHDTGPISEEIPLIGELSAPTHDRSQGEKERGTRKYLPIEACTANHGTLKTPAPSIFMKANPAEAGSQSTFSKGKAKIQCDHCSHKPKGDPRWLQGNLTRHMKRMHPDKYPQSPPVLQVGPPQDGQEPQGPEKKPPALKRTVGHILAANSPIHGLDSYGVQWITFEYSKEREKKQWTIRCDVEAVNTKELSLEFKQNNCVYPQAWGPKDQYRGNRLMCETQYNEIGWALAELNVCLRGDRGLLQRAVDSWRNCRPDRRLHSRRMRRLAKENARRNISGSKASLQQSQW
ncbi:hypothetical protein FANTH_4019 [Fusarium anthophilum]|uniref:DUF8032 domain-containing protein n=1 Tax=Fusarium anthophilum TaxID=48485 RepID=A0A8H4ZQB7_9HYPO|nr:hypothetical protein FANTH_4019 [Fusarium anthophilum]